MSRMVAVLAWLSLNGLIIVVLVGSHLWREIKK